MQGLIHQNNVSQYYISPVLGNWGLRPSFLDTTRDYENQGADQYCTASRRYALFLLGRQR